MNGGQPFRSCPVASRPVLVGHQGNPGERHASHSDRRRDCAGGGRDTGRGGRSLHGSRALDAVEASLYGGTTASIACGKSSGPRRCSTGADRLWSTDGYVTGARLRDGRRAPRPAALGAGLRAPLSRALRPLVKRHRAEGPAERRGFFDTGRWSTECALPSPGRTGERDAPFPPPAGEGGAERRMRVCRISR